MQDRLLNSDLSVNRFVAPVLFLVPALFFLSGCGTETYEQRLKETAQYFAYADTRNQGLSENWSSPTIKMKAPVELKLLSPPVAAPATDSEDPAATEPEPTQTIDPRQPDYIDLVLPGLEGAWSVELPVDLDNESVDRPAYLYVLSNHYLLKEKRMDEAVNFQSDVLSEIERAFNIYLEPENFTTERFPRGKGYSVAKDFLFTSFQPETQIAGIDYQFDIYQAESGNNQVIILLVVPKNIGLDSKLKEHMDYSLETVDIIAPQSRGGQNSASGRSKF